MLFGRKKPASRAEKIRIMLWPRHSWVRSFKYVSKRILRLTGSPHAIAAGVAAGMFASFTPFMGFHFLIAFAVAFLIGGNFLAAALGTFLGNPLTFPVIWASTHQLGTYLLSGERVEDKGGQIETLADTKLMEVGVTGVFDKIIGLWDPVIKPMLIGSVPLGLIVAVTGYICTRWASSAFHAARQRKRELKMLKRHETATSRPD